MFVDVALYIQIAKISQYLAAQDEARKVYFQGGGLTPTLSRLLYVVRTQVETAYNRNSSDATLNSTALYMYALCGNYAARARNIIATQTAGVATIITQPISQSVLVGASATFSVVATSTLPLTYQWYLNGVAIVGATGSSYTFTNAQLIDSGDSFYVNVINSAGTITSNSAFLTVSTTINGGLYYSDIDPYPTLVGGTDPFTYQISFVITTGQPFVIALTAASSANHYLTIKAPSGQSIKTIWNNTPFNLGTIPDSVFRASLQFGGNTYYTTWNPTPMDDTSPLTLT